jgi:hypothetical protein
MIEAALLEVPEMEIDASSSPPNHWRLPSVLREAAAHDDALKIADAGLGLAAEDDLAGSVVRWRTGCATTWAEWPRRL